MGLTDEAKEAKNGTEDLDDENLDEQLAIGRVGNGSSRASDTDRYTAEEVAQADDEATPEESVAWSSAGRPPWPSLDLPV